MPEARRRPRTQGDEHQRNSGRDPPALAQLGKSGRKVRAGHRRRMSRRSRTTGDRHGLPPYSSDESISPARHGFDVSWIVGRVAQGTSQLIQRRVQAVLEIDEGTFLPDLLAQLLVGNHLARMRQQAQQNLQWLAGQADADTALE